MLVSGVQVINLVYFVICAKFYPYKPLDENGEMSREDDMEQMRENLVRKKTSGGKEDEERKLSKDQ